jgi:hypothetical protein
MTHKIIRHIKLSKALGVKLEGDAKKINDFFNELFDGLEEYESGKYPDDIFFTKKDSDYVYIHQDSKNETLWCLHDHIWSFFLKEFDYRYNEISNLIQGIVGLHLKRKVFKASHRGFIHHRIVGLHLKRKV